MRPSDHQQSQPPDPPPTPRPDPTPSGTSRKNRHPEHRYASDRTRARNDNQSRNALLIGAFRFKRPLFRTRPIVEWSIGGIPSVTSTCFSSRRSVQR